MQRTKVKKALTVKRSEFEIIRDDIKTEVFHIERELVAIDTKWEGVDIDAETALIGDSLRKIEGYIDEIEGGIHELEKEIEDKKEAITDITDELERLQAAGPCISIEGNGKIDYYTDNLLDAQIMQEMELCLKGNPYNLLNKLREISREYGTCQLIAS